MEGLEDHDRLGPYPIPKDHEVAKGLVDLESLALVVLVVLTEALVVQILSVALEMGADLEKKVSLEEVVLVILAAEAAGVQGVAAGTTRMRVRVEKGEDTKSCHVVV